MSASVEVRHLGASGVKPRKCPCSSAIGVIITILPPARFDRQGSTLERLLPLRLLFIINYTVTYNKILFMS